MCTPTAALFFSIFFVTVRAIDIYAKKREREEKKESMRLWHTGMKMKETYIWREVHLWHQYFTYAYINKLMKHLYF
jgi:hypothetical protein